MKQNLFENCIKLENSIITYSRAGGGAGSILLITTNANISVHASDKQEIHKDINYELQNNNAPRPNRETKPHQIEKKS